MLDDLRDGAAGPVGARPGSPATGCRSWARPEVTAESWRPGTRSSRRPGTDGGVLPLCDGARHEVGSVPRSRRRPGGPTISAVFLFFNSRMGCLGSLLVSVLLTVVLLLFLGIL